MRRALLVLVALLLLAGLATLGGGAWLLGTQAGLRWALARAESASGGRLAVREAQGTLARGVRAQSVAWTDPAMRIEAREVALRVDLLALLSGRIGIAPLEAASLDIETATGGSAPAAPRIAFPLRLGDVRVARLKIRDQVLNDVRLAHLDAGPGLSAEGSFERPDERYPAQVQFRLQGPFERLQLEADYRVAGVPGRASAVLAPFAALPLESLEASAGPLDLRSPGTALYLRVLAKSAAAGIEGMLAMENTAAGPLDAQRLPVQRAETRFASPDLKSAELDALRIVLHGGGTLQGRATLSAQRATASVQAAGINLRALRTNLVQTALRGPLDIEIAGEEQSLRGTLAQQDMSISAHAVRRGELVEVRALRAAAHGGEITGKGTLRLVEPPAFRASLKLERFNPAAFGAYPEGSLNGTLEADGRLGADPYADARWAIAKSRLLGHPFESRGEGRFSQRRVRGANAEARMGSSRASLRGDFGRPGERLAWTLAAPRLQEHLAAVSGSVLAEGVLEGAWDRPTLSASARAQALELPRGIRVSAAALNVAGSVERHEIGLVAQMRDSRIDARAAGGWSRDEGWAGTILSLANTGPYPGRLVAPAPLRVSPGRVALGRFEASVGGGRLLVQEAAWSRERFASSGEFSGMPGQWLVLAAGLDERIHSTMRVDGRWSLAAAPRLDGTLLVRRRSGELTLLGAGEVALGIKEAVLDARFAGGGVRVRLDLDTSYGSLAAEGEAKPDPAATGFGFGPGSPLAFRARIDFADIGVLGMPVLTHARIDGRLAADLQVGGTLGAPALGGTLRGDGLALEMPPYGVFLKNGELRATLEGDRLRVERFAAQGGAGELSASGILPLRFAAGGARLAWRARNLTVFERPDLRLVASGEGEAGFDGKRVHLTGIVRAERGYLGIERDRLPKLGADVVVLGRERAAEPARRRLPVSLDLELDLGHNLAVDAHGVEGKLAGRLQLASNRDGELRAYGRVQLVNAVAHAYGQRLQVDPGVLIFDGPLDNPSLQISAWRRNQSVEAGVQITGNARAPRVQLVSQPPLPEGERLSWLVLGRAPADATKADLGLLQAAAGALLSRGDAMPLDRRMARAFGLDEVTLRGSGELQDRVVAFGKRLSDRLYISYEQGIGAVASNLVKLDFSLGSRWSLRAETGTSSGAGIFYRFSWD